MACRRWARTSIDWRIKRGESLFRGIPTMSMSGKSLKCRCDFWGRRCVCVLPVVSQKICTCGKHGKMGDMNNEVEITREEYKR